MKTAIYPGSFDPITKGHLNIIERAAKIFDVVVVCVMVNSDKKNPLFSLDERLQLINKVIGDLPNVRVETFSGLLAEYAKRHEPAVIVKGLRAVSDFETEFQMALINRKVNPNLDTFFLTASEQYTYLSSSVVKELARYGADLSSLLPEQIIGDVLEKMRNRGKAE